MALHTITDLRSCRAILKLLKKHDPNATGIVLPRAIWDLVILQAKHDMKEINPFILNDIHLMVGDTNDPWNFKYATKPAYDWDRAVKWDPHD